MRTSFARANPKFGQYDSKGKPIMLPGCLDTLLTEVVVPNAKQDLSSLFRETIAADAELQAVLGEYQEKIAFYFDEVTRFASPFRKGALSLEAWVEVCKGNIKTAGRIPKEGPKKEGLTAWDKVKKAYLTKCDGDEPLIGDFTVKRESEISGDERTRERFSCRLTLLEAKFAFLNSQDMNQMKAGDAENDDAMATLDLKEFTECICRCGRDKYNECKPMVRARCPHP